MNWSEYTTKQLAGYLEGMDQDAGQGIGLSEEHEADTMGIMQELRDRDDAIYKEHASLEDEHSRTEDYHTSEDIMRLIEKLDQELEVIGRLLRPRQVQ